jgi:hypothetical protein
MPSAEVPTPREEATRILALPKATVSLYGFAIAQLLLAARPAG